METLDDGQLRNIKRTFDRLYAHLVTRKAFPNERLAKLYQELVLCDLPGTPRRSSRSFSVAREIPSEEADELVASESWDSLLMQRRRREDELVVRMPPPSIRVGTPSIKEDTPSIVEGRKKGGQVSVDRARVEAQSRLPLDDSVEHPSRRLKKVFLPKEPVATNGVNGVHSKATVGSRRKIFAKARENAKVIRVDSETEMEFEDKTNEGTQTTTQRKQHNTVGPKSDDEEEQPLHRSHKRRRIESPHERGEEVAFDFDSEEDPDDLDALAEANSPDAAELANDDFELEWMEESRRPKRMRMKPQGAQKVELAHGLARAGSRAGSTQTPMRSISPSDSRATVRWSSRTREQKPVYAFTKRGYPKALASSTPRASTPAFVKEKHFPASGRAAGPKVIPAPRPASVHKAAPAPRPAAAQKSPRAVPLVQNIAARLPPVASPRSRFEAERTSANAGTVIFHRKACLTIGALPRVDMDNLWAVHWQLAREPAASRKRNAPFLYRNMRAQGNANRRLRRRRERAGG